jgi:pilus assembly protein Flp/PilA
MLQLMKTNIEWLALKTIGAPAKRLFGDKKGAALIEYTVLLGILVVAVIATIVAVGGWVNGKWTALNTEIQKN